MSYNQNSQDSFQTEFSSFWKKRRHIKENNTQGLLALEYSAPCGVIVKNAKIIINFSLKIVYLHLLHHSDEGL